VLRELAAWESGSPQRNVPRGRVMRDEVLLQLAPIHPNRSMSSVVSVASVPPRLMTRRTTTSHYHLGTGASIVCMARGPLRAKTGS